MKKITIFSAILIAVLGLCGCQMPEYYQESAVNRARTFLLEKMTDLTLEEVAYIKYNRPVIVHEKILGNVPSVRSSKIGSDLSQIGIVWRIPERKDMIMVWGVSSESLMYFRPERVIVREINPVNKKMRSALAKSRRMVLNNLSKELTVLEYNYVRFAEPEILITSFEFDKDVPESSEEKTEKTDKSVEVIEVEDVADVDELVSETDDEASYGEEKLDKQLLDAEKVQFAFVWKIKNGQSYAIVAGEANPDFSAFTPYANGIFSEEEFNEYRVKSYEEFVAELEESAQKQVENTAETEQVESADNAETTEATQVEETQETKTVEEKEEK